MKMRMLGSAVPGAFAAFGLAALGALGALGGPSLSLAADAPTARKPGSYVPHSHTTRHVYGAPISRPILGHAKRPRSTD